MDTIDRKRLRAVVSVALMLVTLGLACSPKNKYVAPPPPEVTVKHPLRSPVTTSIVYTGTTKALAEIEIRARVKGFLKEKLFQENDPVTENQLILVIDEAPFKASVDQAQAKLEEAQAALVKAEKSKGVPIARAQLALNQAGLLLSQLEESRQRSLTSRGAGSREDLDKAQATLKKSQAQVEADEASFEQAKADYEVNILSAKANIAKAEAELTSAKIDLSYCRITSPITGRISRVLVDVGNLVGNNEATLLAVVLKEEPIYAYVTISEADLLMFRKMVRQGTREDFRKNIIPMDLGLLDEVGFPHRGQVQYADPMIDPTSGTVTVRGIFPNPKDASGLRVLYPGSFVRVRVPKDQLKSAVLVPEEAISTDQKGLYVYVVENDKARRQDVSGGSVVNQAELEGKEEPDSKVASARFRIIEQGLEGDELIIVNGLQRARDGLVVKPIIEPTGQITVPKTTSTQ